MQEIRALKESIHLTILDKTLEKSERPQKRIQPLRDRRPLHAFLLKLKERSLPANVAATSVRHGPAGDLKHPVRAPILEHNLKVESRGLPLLRQSPRQLHPGLPVPAASVHGLVGRQPAGQQRPAHLAAASQRVDPDRGHLPGRADRGQEQLPGGG
jgi:hypothetical protein